MPGPISQAYRNLLRKTSTVAPNQSSTNEIIRFTRKVDFGDTAFAEDSKKLESTDDHTIPVKETIQNTKSYLRKVVSLHYHNDPEMHQLIDQVAKTSEQLLEAINEGDDEKIESVEHYNDYLEIVIESDGSRPSLLTLNNVPQFTDGTDEWKKIINGLGGNLVDAISAIGRINLYGEHAGTGCLIGKNLIMTNHHVLEDISKRDLHTGNRILKKEVTIDFGSEYRNEFHLEKKISKIAFCCEYDFKNNPNHKELDLVLLELADDGIEGPKPIGLDLNKDWAAVENLAIFVVGYPGEPKDMPFESIAIVFKKHVFGCKRVAPGRIMSINKPFQWTTCHDASTYHGNSGSPVILIDSANTVAGLHYGGSTKTTPPQNWAHIIGRTTECIDEVSKKSLQEILQKYNVKTYT